MAPLKYALDWVVREPVACMVFVTVRSLRVPWLNERLVALMLPATMLLAKTLETDATGAKTVLPMVRLDVTVVDGPLKTAGPAVVKVPCVVKADAAVVVTAPEKLAGPETARLLRNALVAMTLLATALEREAVGAYRVFVTERLDATVGPLKNTEPVVVKVPAVVTGPEKVVADPGANVACVVTVRLLTFAAVAVTRGVTTLLATRLDRDAMGA